MTDLTAADMGWELPADSYPHADADEWLVDVILEARVYRELAQQALHCLHDVTRELARSRDAHHRTRDEYRALRERVLREAGVSA